MIDVHLHYERVPEHAPAGVIASLEADLVPVEIAAMRRFVFAQHQLLYAAAHSFLRRTLASYLQREPRAIELEVLPGGRPELADRALRFSLSHTAGLVLVGVTDAADIGVDAELVDARTDAESLAPLIFTPRELAEWNGSKQDLLASWTLKESYAKARGLGLSLEFSSFAIRRSAPSAIALDPAAPDASEWQFLPFAPTAQHLAAAAVHSPEVNWILHPPEGDRFSVAARPAL